MAKRYIIDEVRADHWIVRMRDRETNEVVEVPLELGALWPGKLRGDAVPRESSEPSTPRAPQIEAAPTAEAPPSDEAPLASEPAPVAVEPPAEKKPRRRGKARETEPEAVQESVPTPDRQDVDEAILEPDHTAAVRTLRQGMRRANRTRKVGELGWSEVTDDGRSGLVSRFGAGVYKILHAGADTYALFFEWDDGRYDKLGCGPAEAMMDLANFKAKQEPPKPPTSHISEAMARFVCAPEAKPAPEEFNPKERLQAAIDRRLAEMKNENQPPFEPDFDLYHAVRHEVERHKEQEKQAARPKRAPKPIAPNAAMDQQITDSLKRALADLDAQETRGEEGA